ncbi:hypothetical protein [Ornithinibacillus sp. JPR2-1]|uniref:hypothetical protein n=1 Tax=Ornithinibacillus sp. JPR2-1 TaxID=2094019 RepID=UPI0031D0AC8A
MPVVKCLYDTLKTVMKRVHVHVVWKHLSGFWEYVHKERVHLSGVRVHVRMDWEHLTGFWAHVHEEREHLSGNRVHVRMDWEYLTGLRAHVHQEREYPVEKWTHPTGASLSINIT